MKENQASSTAYLIARSTYFLALDRKLGGFVPPQSRAFCKAVIAAHARLPWLTEFCFRAYPLRWLIQAFEGLLLPGVQLHYALRKKCIDAQVRTALGAGFSQLWVVAAGFDSLTLRLQNEFPSVQFREIDHPATQKVKQRVCRQTVSSHSNLTLIPADLKRQPLLSVLKASGDRPHNGNIFVFEGISMYLTEDEVRKIFQSLSDYDPSPLRVIFTFMDVKQSGQIKFHNSSWLVDLWLRLKHEEFTWGIPVGEMPEFLANVGFKCLRIYQADDLREEYLNGTFPSVSLAEGECICIAERK